MSWRARFWGLSMARVPVQVVAWPHQGSQQAFKWPHQDRPWRGLLPLAVQEPHTSPTYKETARTWVTKQCVNLETKTKRKDHSKVMLVIRKTVLTHSNCSILASVLVNRHLPHATSRGLYTSHEIHTEDSKTTRVERRAVGTTAAI